MRQTYNPDINAVLITSEDQRYTLAARRAAADSGIRTFPPDPERNGTLTQPLERGNAEGNGGGSLVKLTYVFNAQDVSQGTSMMMMLKVAKDAQHTAHQVGLRSLLSRGLQLFLASGVYWFKPQSLQHIYSPWGSPVAGAARC